MARPVTRPLRVQCAWCLAILGPKGVYRRNSAFVKHTGPRWSHGICPDCAIEWFMTIPDAPESEED